MGGFSNGAHTTAMLLSAVDPFILEHFNNFYLLDGGFVITSSYKRLVAGKNILAMVGGSRKDKERRLILRLLNAEAQAAKEQQRNFSLIKMPGVEHAFPDEYMGTLQSLGAEDGAAGDLPRQIIDKENEKEKDIQIKALAQDLSFFLFLKFSQW